MPDINGFPTIRECELEIENQKLRRERDMLRWKHEVLSQKPPLYVDEREIITPTLLEEIRLPCVGVGGIDSSDKYCYRIWARTTDGIDNLEQALYINKSELYNHDKRQLLAYLLERNIRQLAAA